MSMAFSSLALANPVFPSKPVKIIVSLPVGSGPDMLARLLAEDLSAKWQQPVVVVNRPGGSGQVAINAFLGESSSDNHVILFTHNQDVISYPVLYQKSDFLNNIEPIATSHKGYLTLVVSGTHKNLKAFLQKIATQEKISIGSWGIGSSSQLLALQFLDQNQIQTVPVHVPYREYAQWFTDIANGTLDFGFATHGSTLAMFQSGKISWAMTADSQRTPHAPNIPSWTEVTNQTAKIAKIWSAFYVNSNMPADIKQKLQADLENSIRASNYQKRLHILLYETYSVSMDEFRADLVKETQEYKDLLKKYKISPQ